MLSGEASPASPSLRRNSVARLAADGCGVVSAFAIAAITARLLGPSGKGFYSSLILMSGIVVQIFSAGMGESAIVLLGQRKVELQDAAGATVAAALSLSAVGALSMFVVSHAVLHVGSHTEAVAVVFASALVLLHTPSLMLVAFLNSMERIVAVAAIFVTYSVVATVAVWALTSLTGLGVAGAVIGNAAGNAVMLVVILILLRRAGLPLRPRWRPEYLRAAMRFGLAVQLSNLLVLVTGRVDLLFVYRISGSAAAGRYSIALTIGILVGIIPLALAYASFPRLANLEDGAARALTSQIFRVGMILVAGAAALLGSLTPLAVPLLFGTAYRGAVRPGLVLVVGGVFWSAQWLLGRAAAARGKPAALCVSFGVSFAVMVGLDLLLIAPFGEMGAALAAFASSVAGLAVTVQFYRRKGWDWRDFVPGRRDVESLVGVVSDILDATVRRRPALTEQRST